MNPEHTAVISIGTNLGKRKTNIKAALKELCAAGKLTSVSRIYRTKPYGLAGQPDFINLAVVLNTDLQPLELLNHLLSIEARLGRVRTERWGPRIIDLDIIFYNAAVINLPQLTVPHPDMHRRAFVLDPLLDICPDKVHPVLNKSVRELRKSLM